MKRNKNLDLGITLVALIITVVILLILAGISLKYVLGTNGIINRSEYAKQEYENAKENEKKGLDELYSSIMIATNGNSQVTVSVEDLKKIIDAQIEEKIKTVSVSSNPVGTIIAQMGTTPPEGYLFCDGSIYNIADYKQLAEYIKNQFGTYNYWGGDGETTFAIPNLQGEFLRGYSTNESKSVTDGVTTEAVGRHQNGTSSPTGFMTSSNTYLYLPNNPSEQMISKDYDILLSTKHTRTIQFKPNITENQKYEGVVGMFTSRPTNTSVLYCIKY